MDDDFNTEDSNYIMYDNCPICNRWFDEIDYDYQICSRCGWAHEPVKKDEQ